MFNDTIKTIRITAPSNTNSIGRTLPTKISCKVEFQLSIGLRRIICGKSWRNWAAMTVSRA